MDTSIRGYIIDHIESIGEQLALSSHLSEKILLLKKELNEYPKDLSDLEINLNEELIKDQAEVQRKLDETIWLRTTCIEDRRLKMQWLKKWSSKEGDSQYWCSVKHSIKNLVNTLEVYDALKEDEQKEFYEHVETAYSLVAGCLGLFLGIKIPSCWACLTDALILEK